MHLRTIHIPIQFTVTCLVLFSKLSSSVWVEDCNISLACAAPESFARGGSTLTTFFHVDEGIEDPNTIISKPSSTRWQNAISMAFRWRADVGQTLNAGLAASGFFRGAGPVLLRNPIFL